MIKLSITLALILLFAIGANAQLMNVTVKTGTTLKVYPDLESAIIGAETGSDLYIGGGEHHWANWNVIMLKELHFYGVGHYPSTTEATGKTKIIGRPQIGAGADNSTFTGIEFDEMLIRPETSVKINNISFSRCKFNWRLVLDTAVTNLKVSECVICNGVSCLIWTGPRKKLVGAIFEKNIFIDGVYGVRDMIYCQFNNNIFLGVANQECIMENVHNCLFKNNIFLSNRVSHMIFHFYAANSTNNIFQNNFIFIKSFNPTDHFYPGYSNISINNYFYPDEDPTNVFQNFSYSQDLLNKIFDYSMDYHLKSPYNASTFSTDGYEMGIYGTSNPYKEGAVPVIPHITNSQIGGQLIDGNLQINVTVEAQTK